MHTRKNTRSRRMAWAALAIILSLGGLTSIFSTRAAAQTQQVGKIAFDRGSNTYTINADGSNETLVGSPSALALDPSWSPDGTKLAYSCGTEPTNVCVMNADGSNVISITNDNADRHPAWSPDGTKIAFTGFREGSTHIYYISPNGGAIQRVTVNDATILGESNPAWSPDSTRIAFVGESETGYDIYTTTLDGTVERVTSTFELKSNPAWSPDGSQIVFDTIDTISVVNVGGGAVSVLASAGDSNEMPAWSPDGARIVFRREIVTRTEDGSIIGRQNSLYLMNADGSGVMNLNTPGSNPTWQIAQIAPPPPPVQTPAERIAALDALVRSFNLHHGTTNSLVVKLRNALADLDAGNTAGACAKLADFINHTRAQSGKKLTQAQATALIDEATSIRAALGCN